jgi:hypothetical protein
MAEVEEAKLAEVLQEVIGEPSSFSSKRNEQL